MLRSLHAKAIALKPTHIEVKPSNIWVGVLRTDRDANGELVQDDFLWVKCNAGTNVGKIHERFEQINEGKPSSLLKYNGKPINMNGTVGPFNTFRDNLVVFEAGDAEAGDPEARDDTGNPLSPKDANARLPPHHLFPSKPSVKGTMDENTIPAQTIKSETPTPHGSYNRVSTNIQPTQSPATSAEHAPRTKVERGQFSEFRRLWHNDYRNQFPDDTEEEFEKRMLSYWLTSDSSTAPPPSSHTATALSSSGQPPLPVTEVNSQEQKHFQLSALLGDASPQVWESSVEASVKLLDTLRAPLADKMASSPDADHWIQQIDNLKKQAVKTRTVIGVVGNTGAGKSSVINAMLDEERLVPTNCMRACTAVVTEISYNNEDEPYCAEIEFITAEDWAKELKVLFQDLLDSDGNVSRECTNEDSDAGVAYAKIKAVYPQKTKEDISKSNVEKMLKEVSHILGTSRNIKESNSTIFYKKLQGFVDSKEKSTGQKDKDGKKPKKEREFWPLIRVVRLYVKSPALATGAVVVDLPGVHDANAARAAVAEGYMKQCTGLWIVAPINRAVDDKAAKSLLGESFKRQLKMDGGFSAVTFICSKTDDISIMEAQDSLGLDEKMGPSWEELDRLSAKQKALKKQLEKFNETKNVYEDVANDADEQIEVWETLQESVNDGKTAFAPKAKSASKKRKAGDKDRPSKKKKQKKSSDAGDSDFIDDEVEAGDDSHDSDEDQGNDSSEDGEPLTEDQITTKLQELKTTKKDARKQKAEIKEKVEEVRKQLKEMQAAESKINSEMSALCISGRNQYSKGAIQQDFAAGIKEIDQEIAAEEDEENFNPEAEVRDYDEVARSLPVFCVSSRGYQKLQGRLLKDPHVPGFTTVEETEIPALQAHCEKLTETGRAANCRAFINKLSSLLNSLTLWASSDGTGANLTAEQKAREARYLEKGMEALETRLEKATKSCAKELAAELQDNIFDRYQAAVQAATHGSIDTTTQWGAPVCRENRAAGGLYWATYKAVCRRDGSFTNAQGLHDWNAQLIEPMIKLIAPGWEKTFTRRVQVVMNSFTKTVPSILKKFHHDIEDRARKLGTGLASLSMLLHQLTVYEQILKDLASSTKDMVIAAQKDINREFVPVIQGAMQPSYTWCAEESGPGQYKRMKSFMTDHVEQQRNSMFQQSADEVHRQLLGMVNTMGETLADRTDEVFIQIKRDYRSVLGGGAVSQGEVIPRVHRQARREVNKTLGGVERKISRVIGLDVEESEAEVADEDAKSEPEGDKSNMVRVKNEDGHDSSAFSTVRPTPHSSSNDESDESNESDAEEEEDEDDEEEDDDDDDDDEGDEEEE
ncbi:MAG: hypothetical protein Q9170_003290 [Blastenia crenularia]